MIHSCNPKSVSLDPGDQAERLQPLCSRSAQPVPLLHQPRRVASSVSRYRGKYPTREGAKAATNAVSHSASSPTMLEPRARIWMRWGRSPHAKMFVRRTSYVPEQLIVEVAVTHGRM